MRNLTQPYLSVVIPAFNEEERIASTVEALVAYLESWAGERTWELLVVSDGSTDSTAKIVSDISAGNSKVRLVDAPHGGKGAAVRRGMDEAAGEWRFLCDADLSMPASNLGRFFEGSGSNSGNPRYDVSIGSREAQGAKRFSEPRSRHIKGRLFNYAVKVLALRGIEDTQCGFKLFSAEAARKLFPHQSLDGWAFDVELLVLAKTAKFSIGEIPIDWYYGEGSKMTLTKGLIAVLDVARVGLNRVLRKYGSVERKGGA
ncbi:glycosyltransferase [Candidatus Lucifugimonas marina]|uniref:dolichyl-phosphate beta-glucosyltransferase n=1 Tax=Candidatus Lucifugimonas marina TaxID=3038979 RepID=A0AAJ5ZFC1_9CHLR|nr:glycosyltransferase [SAR202 cluster bacterium JH702]MDG0869633.1 glycosyltransferase [SAR202 cluster bacterium JH639]WFG34366.1 glycosyltransferase [SAR202 cluster bacterium JH545]WFG38295.1 glycosyltransferase [SAR202 cluster bacterium JH1073]